MFEVKYEKGYMSKNGKYKYWLFNKFDERKPWAIIRCSEEEIANDNTREQIIKDCGISENEYTITFAS